MNRDPQDALSELLRAARAHVAWARDLGLTGIDATAHKSAVADFRARLAPAAPQTAPQTATTTTRTTATSASTTASAQPPRITRPRDLNPTPPRDDAPPRPHDAHVAGLVRETMEKRRMARQQALATPPPADAPTERFDGRHDPLAVVAAELDQLRTEIGPDCRRCRLCEARSNIVFGVGNPKAELVFVGEGPGADEDRVGEPFVGRAGQLLDKIIAAMGLSRDNVYICNVVKCRPPANRVPEPDEMEVCGAFLTRQLLTIRPRVIVALGATPTRYLLGPQATIGATRGKFATWRGAKLMPTYHPAYLLRTPSAKRMVWDDMQLVMAELGLARPPDASQ